MRHRRKRSTTWEFWAGLLVVGMLMLMIGLVWFLMITLWP